MRSSQKSSIVGVVFNSSREKVLLVKRRDVPVWVLPGGGLETGETPEQGIIREIHEETGLDVVVLRKVSLYTPINRLSYPTHFFECKEIGGQLNTNDEAKEVFYASLEELPKTLFFLHRSWIVDALENSPFIIEKPLVEVTYFNLICYFFRHPLRVFRFALSRLGIPINSR